MPLMLLRLNCAPRGRKSEFRFRKQEEEAEDNGLEEDSGDSQENEETSLEQENEKVLEILGESDKSEQLKEEAPEVEESVDQDDSCVESLKTKEEDVFVTIESADNTLDLDDETNKECEEETNPLGPDDGESLEQNTGKDTDFEMVAIDSTGGQSSQMQPYLDENLEYEMKTQPEEEAKDGEKALKDENTEEASTKVSSAKEDDQRMSLTEEETDRNVKTDEKGQTGNSSGRNLWVSGLSSTTRATDLKNLFSKYGKVVGAKVVTNARSPGARCYGFVTMSSSEDATKCINHLHRTELHGRMISVEKAKNEPAGKKPSEKKESEPKREKSSSSDQRHSTDKHEKSSPSLKDEASDKGDDKTAKEKAKEDHRSDRSRTSKSGSRGTERTVVMDKSKGEPVISVKTSSDSKERSSKSQDRKSGSKEKREILSFDKIKEQRERERQRQREREIREMERQRERDRRVRERLFMMREREERERLRRERVRLQFERERLDRERMERERLERERMRIEEERRIEQERIQREREELRRQQERLRYEQDRRGIRRPYDVDARRDEPYWPDSKRMALDDRYRDFGRTDRFNDFENRDRGRYMDHMHLDRRDDSRSGMGGRDMNYSDRHGRDQRDGWGDYDRRVDDGRVVPPPGRDGRDWGEHGRKMESDRSRPGDRGMPGSSGQGHMTRGVHGFIPNENSQNMSAMGLQGGNFGGQNRPNEPRFPHRY
ncbi:PREDICTED: scaffold attachment factor B2-like [Nanorana parkeri]|uniref:scaffold attachment factor B2-like n=1 Tax=Nanorana parkeri TaxID=125878 RepID=UPI00085500EF|nr:PREDICTED: scaffold attachment factor B2-like [Nanorana parkeri]